DEIDALAPRRGGSSDSNVSERVISQLLTELDGLEDLHDVVVLAATNRPDLIDPALLRQGRFDRHIMVDKPDKEARKEIFKVHTKDKPVADDVDLDRLASKTDEMSGADIASICNEAVMLSIREFVDEGKELTEESVKEAKVYKRHFDEALKKVKQKIEEREEKEKGREAQRAYL
ncbi:MAG: AAA family ATPase, partial [Thermoplasmatota archaeon]